MSITRQKMVLSQSPAKRPTFAFADESGYTLAFANRIAHSGLHAETGAFRTGPLSLPSERSARSQTSPGWVSERRTLPLLGLGLVCSRRTQKAFGAAMRLCASLLRGVAAPLGCVIFFRFCRNLWLYAPHSGLSMRARWGWYHYPRHALRTAEGLGARLSKRLICRFLRSDGCRSLYGIFSDISARKIRLLTLPSYYGMIKFTNPNLRIMRRASLHRSPQKLFQRMHLPPFQGGYRRHRHKSNRFYIPPPRLLRYF